MHVKICGVTTPEAALACADLGATAIGVNFVPSSPRHVSIERAREIRQAIAHTSVQVVGVVADLGLSALQALLGEVDSLQLHGDEPPEALLPLLPRAYKATRIATREDVDRARRYPGDILLVDAKSAGGLGGTGTAFDWSLVIELARERKVILAGGLRPDNVSHAVRLVAPWGVDVASGVEHAPGEKDLDAVREFIAEADVRRRR
jgi:phosphoribosylanthranilate isomerase